MGKTSCLDKHGLKKGPWTAEEDQKLIDYIQKNGYGRWRTLPKNAGLKRCGKSCRLRWTNYLRPDIKRGKFSIEEEDTIIQLHSVLGNKWSAIAAHLPGRTDNEIKNYWNTHIKKRLLKMGIDPVTHKPRLDLLQLYSVLNSSLYGLSNYQFTVPNSLGIGPLLGPDIVNLATYLSTQANNDQNQLDIQNQAQFPSIEPIQAHNSSHSANFSGSSDQFSNEGQPIQVNLGQVSNYHTNLEYQDNLLENPWQAQREPSNIGDDFVRNCGDYDTRSNYQAILNTPLENLTNLSFDSLLWKPSSTTCFNGGMEDERDSYWSNNYINMPNRLDIASGFM